MAERWYLVPVARGAGNRVNVRGPAYVWADNGPPDVDTRPGGWSVMDTPDDDATMILICHDIGRAEHAQLAARPGVITFPADLSRPVTRQQRRDIEDRTVGPPGQLAGMTHREAIEELLARTLQAQAFYGRHHRHPTGTELDQVLPPAAARSAIRRARPPGAG